MILPRRKAAEVPMVKAGKNRVLQILVTLCKFGHEPCLFSDGIWTAQVAGWGMLSCPLRQRIRRGRWLHLPFGSMVWSSFRGCCCIWASISVDPVKTVVNHSRCWVVFVSNTEESSPRASRGVVVFYGWRMVKVNITVGLLGSAVPLISEHIL